MADKTPGHITDAEAESAENETDVGFPPSERRVFTQSYDLSVQTLVDKWDADELILPEIQREYVWDNPRASRLMESLLLNIPIPVLYFAETDDAKWEIIDGHQRVNSVVRFVQNEFALSSLVVLADLNRRRFYQIPEREQRFLKSRTMRAVLVSADSHPNMKFEIFERLNTGAIVLTAQELRNSLYRGPFNRLLHTLVEDGRLRAAVGTKSRRARMVDEELVLRFFALRSDLANYRPPLKTYLNNYMRSVQNADEAILAELVDVFEVTLDRLASVFSGRAFRISDSDGDPIEHALNRAIFDAEMLSFSWITDPLSAVKRSRGKVLTGLAELFEDDDFFDTISRATGDRTRTLFRTRAVIEVLQGAGLTVDAPRAVRP